MADNTTTLLDAFRRKFITTNMLFALAVIVAMFGALLGVSYMQHVNDVYDALEARVNMAERFLNNQMGNNPRLGTFGLDNMLVPSSPNNTSLPDEASAAGVSGGEGRGNAGAATGTSNAGAATGTSGAGIGSGTSAADTATGTGTNTSTDTGAATDAPTLDNQPPFDQGMGGRREVASDQIVATALYFVQGDGTVLAGNNETFSIDDDMLTQALSEIVKTTDDGTLESDQDYLPSLGLYYKVRPAQDDIFIVAFASSQYISQSIVQLAIMLALAGLAALLAFLLLNMRLSHWVVRPVEEAWRQQQQFIADASHELKTPLTVITANDSILLSQPDATINSQRQWIESTETEAHLMQDLVNDMLYLAKSDASKQPLEYGQVDFSNLVTSQVLQFEAVAFEKGVQIDAQVQEGVTLYGDASRLQRLVGVLLDNACKYVDDNGQIILSLKATDKESTLQVRNTGSVVDKEDIPHLFDRFYRSDKARTRGEGGFGLGLSIAKSIVDDHKGTISVASNETDGTTFIVTLPL